MKFSNKWADILAADLVLHTAPVAIDPPLTAASCRLLRLTPEHWRVQRQLKAKPDQAPKFIFAMSGDTKHVRLIEDEGILACSHNALFATNLTLLRRLLTVRNDWSKK